MLNRRTAVAVVFLFAAPAARAAFSTSTFTASPYASFEYLGQQAKNETDFDNAENDERGNTVDRIRLGLNIGFSDQLRGGVEVVRAPFIAGTPNQDAQFGNPPRSVNTELSNFYLENAFLEMDDGARPYKLSLFREMTRIMNEAKASGLRLIYATPDPNEPTAEALLTRLGFSRDHKGAWRWQAFQRLSA
jgi:hypothetical protein